MKKQHKTTHTHHIVPTHAGGTDEPENLIELSVPDHAEAHRLLFEKHGNIRDKIAWLCLSGRREEAESYRIHLANEGFQRFLLDPVKNSKWKNKISDSLKGKKQSIETCNKRSNTTKELYRTGQIKPPELTEERKQKLRLAYHRSQLSEKLAAGRRKSEKWMISVTSEESRLKKAQNDPRSKRVMINGVTYPSARNAIKMSGIPPKFINRARKLGSYVDEHNHIVFL